MPESKSSKQAERQERLAAALRANLRKRKAQSRMRQNPTENGADDSPAAPDLREPNPSVTS